MKRTVTAISTVFFIVILLAAIPGAVFLVKLRKETNQFNVLPTGDINPDIFTVEDGMVNMFLLRKNGKYLAVDAGNSVGNIRNQLKSAGIRGENVSGVLLTHTDYDHTGALPLFPDAEIYISAPEENMLNGKVHRTLFFNNKLKRQYTTLEDGERRNIAGWDIQTIVIPGHTSGSACYLVDGKYLFTGDTGLKDNRITPFNAFFCVNRNEQEVSLKKLDSLHNIEIVLTAHYGITRNYRNQ